eukprot:Sspe_Gene.35965::Locus_17418_Transcript_2_2_Confidence_0.750_Length_1502::g.35965::m.35965
MAQSYMGQHDVQYSESSCYDSYGVMNSELGCYDSSMLSGGLPSPPPLAPSQSTLMAPPSSCPQYSGMGEQHGYVTVMSPSGQAFIISLQDYGNLGHLKEEIARQFSMPHMDFQLGRVSHLVPDSPLTHQCVGGDTIYILPTALPHYSREQGGCMNSAYQEVPTMMGQQQGPRLPTSTIPSTPLSAISRQSPGTSFGTISNTGSNTTPLHGSDLNWPLSLEERIELATQQLPQVISQSRQCNELQYDLESAMSAGIDCSALFQTVQRLLPELIVHPSGNYLVTKCFDLCPSLIDSASALITQEIQCYALHKHASYVVEAILGHAMGSKQSKRDVVLALISPPNRVAVATHDSGNFVLQRAIEHCPEELLWQLKEAVQSVVNVSTHGSKMLKKLETRMARCPPETLHPQLPGHTESRPPAVSSSAYGTLPLPPSTAAYVHEISKQKQHQHPPLPPPPH